MKKRLWSVVIPIIAMVYPLTSFAVHDEDLFELDGNAAEDAVVGDDWETVNGGGGGTSLITSTGVLADPGLQTFFTTGKSKDTEDVSQWKWKDDTGGGPNDKADITNAYAAAYKNAAGDLIVYFGADRFTEEGTAAIGAWFFQDGNVGLDMSGGQTKSFTGQHIVNDLLVLAEFVSGGTVGEFRVLRWVGTGGDEGGGTLQTLISISGAKCGDTAGDQACAISNSTPVPVFWSYTPKGGSPGDPVPVNAFFEGGVNVTQLLQSIGGPTPCFTKFMLESRTSQQVNSTLKDFVLGDFNVCNIEITKQCLGGVVDGTGTAFIYDWQVTVENTGFATVNNVNITDDSGTPGNANDDFSFLLANSLAPGTSVTSSVFQTITTIGPYTNTATATADIGGGAQLTDTDSDTCPKPPTAPGINTTKECTTNVVSESGLIAVKVDYNGQVCNTGDVKLNGVFATNDIFQTPMDSSDDIAVTLAFPTENGALFPGECADYADSYFPSPTLLNGNIPANQAFTDTVTGFGTPAIDGVQISDPGSDTCPLCE